MIGDLSLFDLWVGLVVVGALAAAGTFIEHLRKGRRDPKTGPDSWDEWLDSMAPYEDLDDA